MSQSQLCLHRGARPIERAILATIEAPPPQRRWFPVSHFAVLQAVENTLTAAGFGIQTSRYGISEDRHRFFGTLDLTTPVSTGVALVAGVRNSTDRTFPLGFCAGHRVFVCDNLSFAAELLVKRKHTRHGSSRFGEAIGLAVSGLTEFREAESARIRRMIETECSNTLAESLMLRAYDQGIVSHRQLPGIIKEWREPTYEEFADRTLWSAFNAFTTVMNDRAKSNPAIHAQQTMRLQALICPN
jgi:hypothetical protein